MTAMRSSILYYESPLAEKEAMAQFTFDSGITGLMTLMSGNKETEEENSLHFICEHGEVDFLQWHKTFVKKENAAPELIEVQNTSAEILMCREIVQRLKSDIHGPIPLVTFRQAAEAMRIVNSILDN